MQDQRVLDLTGTSIMVVSPHPDDEVLGAGGLIHAAARAGYEVMVVSVTDGAAAYPDWAGLNEIRRREVSDALQRLAPFQVDHRFLGIPDGHVAQQRAVLFEAINRAISSGTLLVAPYERDGHPDHDATGEVCCEIARLRAVTLWRYPIWSWHHKIPQDFRPQSWGRFLLDAAAAQAKAQALTCFPSQMRPEGRAPIVPNHVLEYFTRAYEAFLV